MVGTFNVRTAREGYMRLELVSRFLESGMEIVGIQEHRNVHQEPIRIRSSRRELPWSQFLLEGMEQEQQQEELTSFE